MVEHHVLEVGRQVDLRGLHPGKLPKASDGSVLAPCCTAPDMPYSSRAALDERRQRIEVELDLGDLAVRQHHAAVDVPVWTEILQIPSPDPAASEVRLYPSMKACSSSTVLFFVPTSPISAPTDTARLPAPARG